jgi:hypothetical protein
MKANNDNEPVTAVLKWCDSAERAALRKALSLARKRRAPLMLELRSHLAMAMGAAHWLGPKVSVRTFETREECVEAARTAIGFGVYAWGGIVTLAAGAA